MSWTPLFKVGDVVRRKDDAMPGIIRVVFKQTQQYRVQWLNLQVLDHPESILQRSDYKWTAV